MKALKTGYRLIDTAENYHNEEAVGDAIIDSGIDRNKIIIISKYFGGVNYGNPTDVINSFNRSLKKLKTNYIDVYLVHTPVGAHWVNEWEPIHNDNFIHYKKRISVWLQMIELKKQKLVHYIGVSNWTINNIIELKHNNLCIPDFIQIEWCPCYHDNEIYNFCTNHSIRIIGYGLFSRNSVSELNMSQLQTTGKSPSQILIKWCVQKNIIIIPRSNNIEKLLINFNTVKDRWLLCDADIQTIENTPQQPKGHCLNNLYEKNSSINLWPITMNQ